VRLRLPITAVIVPVGLVIGGLLVGRPVSIDNDLVLDPASVSVTSTTSTPRSPSQDDGAAGEDSASSRDTEADGSADEVTARIVVANATSVSGLAAGVATLLDAAGFVGSQTTDAPPSAYTVVYVREDFRSAGDGVAETLGLDAAFVLPFGSDPVTTLDADADVLVVLGGDRVGAS
jgi:hypothetical protein